MEGERNILTVRLENILSYGPGTPVFKLEPLNVLIGPNGSGKSNFIEALSVLALAPRDIQAPLREGGGVREWLWKGSAETHAATIQATVPYLSQPSVPLRYGISFTADHQGRFLLNDEFVEEGHLTTIGATPKSYYRFRDGQPVINVEGKNPSEQQIKQEDVRFDQSILSQRQDPTNYLALTVLGYTFNRMCFYREFPLGRNAPPRLPQQADLPQHFLDENASNLAVVLSYLQNHPQMKKWIFDQFRQFYPSILDIRPRILGGAVQVFFEEEHLNDTIPATRISDGSLRFLCLLAALFGPDQPSVICIEEPEMGLHPDVIPQLAKLLVEASKRSQIIVTTHSDILVDALSDTPEAIVICEKVDGATQLRRLDPDELKVWLEKYRLGELWTSGHLGGNLW